MRKILLISILACLPAMAQAADVANANSDWSGTGELGFAATRGNTKSSSLNAKLSFSKEDATWKDNFYITALRNKGTVSTTKTVDGETVSVNKYKSTANRIETGGSMGYKLSLRSYVVGALRYERDDFAAYRWQAAASIGYGYILIKDKKTELSFEAGPGYKRVQPIDYIEPEGDPPVLVKHTPGTEGSLIARGLMKFKHQVTDNTAIEDTFLIEAGSDNTFYQNDANLVVNMNKKLALKLGYQVRHNTQVEAGNKATDQLFTTNLVYNF